MADARRHDITVGEAGRLLATFVLVGDLTGVDAEIVVGRRGDDAEVAPLVTATATIGTVAGSGAAARTPITIDVPASEVADLTPGIVYVYRVIADGDQSVAWGELHISPRWTA